MSCESSTTDFPSERDRVDTLLVVLADQQRRQILRYFQEEGDPVVSVETLVDHLVDSDRVHGDRARERVHIRLHHSHLPKLAETTVIEYDPDTATVEYHGHPGLDYLLEIVDVFESATVSSQTIPDRSS